MEIAKYRSLICYWFISLLYSLHPNGEVSVRQLFEVMQWILAKCIELLIKH